MNACVESDLVQLRKVHMEHGLAVGAVGTVVPVHRRGAAHEVEFVRPDGRPQAVLTLPAAAVAALAQPLRRAAQAFL